MNVFALPLFFGLSPALAQEVYADSPAAIPVDEQAIPLAVPSEAPGDGPRHPSERPGAQRSPQSLQALRQYQDERLSIHAETEYSGGSSVVVGGVWGGGYRPGPYGGLHYSFGVPSAIVTEPITLERGWGVYQGPQRLDTPELLRATGQDIRATDLERDIRRAKFASNVWLGVAGAGVATAISGMMAQSIAESRDEAIFFNNVTLGGAGVAALGLIGSSMPAARARALRHDPSTTLSLQETQELVRKNNEALRSQLGLSPDDVWQVESAPPPPHR